MPHTPPLFQDVLLVLLVAVPIAFICRRLRLPLLVGFMLAGILIGPYGLGLIKEIEAIEVLAEIGVILLLFTIGLEFSLRRMLEMKRLVLLGGGLQVGLTIAAVTVIAVLFGRSLNQAVFFGFLFALSSTAIVLKSYIERAEVDAPHGRTGVGILLFQDLSIVLMILLVPVLGGQETTSLTNILITLGTAVAALSLIIGAAWFIVPRLFQQVVGLRSPEVFVITVVLICLGTSWLTAQFGLSLALGAFIAGMVISESEYSHQVTADILPFRDVFNSLFFVSIGMLLSLSAFLDNLGTVLLLVTLLVAGKALIVLAVVRLMGSSLRVSVMTALGLAQIGEFSFILAKTARPVGLLPDADYQSFLAASIISMIATPFLIAAAPRIGFYIQSLNAVPDEDLDKTDTGISKAISELENHVVIVGYGFNGRNLARVLRAVNIPYIVLEVNADMVRQGKKRNEKIVFGDATRHEVLHHVSIEKASIMVVAISDPAATRRTVGQARQFHKDLYIIVRTRYLSELDELRDLGADEVIAEEFETSIEIFSRVLHGYGVSANLIERQVDEIRSQGYRMLRAPSTSLAELSNLNLSIDTATTETVELGTASPANGKTIGELNLRVTTGATVIAAVRDGKTKVNPGANYKLEAGDSLVLLGTQKKIDRAVKFLTAADSASSEKLETPAGKNRDKHPGL